MSTSRFISLTASIFMMIISVCCIPFSYPTKEVCKKMSHSKMTGKATRLSDRIDISGQFESAENGTVHFFPKGEVIWGNMSGVYEVKGDTIYADLYSSPNRRVFGDWSMRQSKFSISSDGNIHLLYSKIYYGGHYTFDVPKDKLPILFRFKTLEITPRIPKFLYTTKWLWNDEKTRKLNEIKYLKQYDN